MNQFKKRFTELGLNDEEFAKKCGVPMETWNSWIESSEDPPRYAWILLSWFMMNSNHMSYHLDQIETKLKNAGLEGDLNPTGIGGIKAYIEQAKEYLNNN